MRTGNGPLAVGVAAVAVLAVVGGGALAARHGTATSPAAEARALPATPTLQFLGTTAEDDDHLLMVVDTGENTASAIIRCSIASGACELATTPARTSRRDALRLTGGWS
ncbi:hypothetical protein [Streptomyces sp. SID13031]|uniref:hypothetical protein n=1 Tax=Streptomyces sp. SID13031 TaxID=2706046 RepID=UPI0013CB277E|nr:hypothetical protein [Streptomyces sp. SID13031]NEA35550.1 hypothetical protein [Streptomyces sp. SID13031]